MKDPLAGFLMLLLVITIIGSFTWLVIWMGKKRTQELQAIAQELKLQFFPKGDARISPLLANLEFFHYGTNCKITNFMHGQLARGRKSVTVAIFDYVFMVGTNRTDTSINIGDDSASIESSNDDDRESFVQTVIIFHDETIDVPAFNLRPENFMDKLGNVVDFQDINFVDFPVFSKRMFEKFLVKFYAKRRTIIRIITR